MPRIVSIKNKEWCSRDGSIRLILGNCIDVMRSLGDKSIDCTVTDPPYGNGTDYNLYQDTQENLVHLVDEFMPQVIRVSHRALITCGVANIHSYPRPSWTLCWATPAGVGSGNWGFCCWQPILAYGDDPYLKSGRGRRPDLFIKTLTAKDFDHPCPKPFELMRWIVRRGSVNGDTVLDPFMGSGTTGAACVRTGRRFIGIEIDPEYFQIAKTRIQSQIDLAEKDPGNVEPDEPQEMKVTQLKRS